MLGAYGRRADPILIELDATLQHDIDHGRSADDFAVHLDASLFPCMDHLILTDPLAIELDTVVWRLVQVKDILEAELNAIVHTAKGRMMVVERRSEVRDQPVPIVHSYLLSMEKAVKILSADMILINVHAHLFLDMIHILLANELSIDTETTSMLEGRVEIGRTHQFTLGVSVAIFVIISF